MKDQLISFETAKLAKEKGFEYITWGWLEKANKDWEEEMKKNFDDTRYHPTQSLLQKWLRSEHGLYAYMDYSTLEAVIVDYKRYEGKELLRVQDHHFVPDWETDEELIEELLQAALKLINQDNERRFT